jgi:nitrous oxidase accessory protein NosD
VSLLALCGALGALLPLQPSAAVRGVSIPAPPASVCAAHQLLSGPGSAPAGAVAVPVSADLSSMVDQAPGGTTFWLAPGRHTLGSMPFDQIVPKDGDTFTGGPGAVLDGQGRNRYAFTQGAKDVTIEYLTIQNFGTGADNQNEGVVNHDSGEGWVITHNTITHNAGAGVVLGSNDVVHANCLTQNGQYGFNAVSQSGVRNIAITDNEISFNDTYDWEAKQAGCGCAGGGKFWDTNGAVVTGNYVHDNRDAGLWADTNDVGFNISNNYISNNFAEGIVYEISYNALISHNVLVRNALGVGPTNPGFPDGAIYISESGADPRVAGPYGTALEISDNLLVDNWSGVVLWESADRFCGSPNNTSTGYCTLVDPAAVNTNTCTQAHLQHARPNDSGIDYYDDCRWKTQNVLVTNNTFAFSPSAVGHGCSTAHSCGLQGLFSQSGSSPSWSPYQGSVVEDAITRTQGNHFSANHYVGPWHFAVHDQSQVVTFSTWQHTWGQDVGSSLRTS